MIIVKKTWSGLIDSAWITDGKHFAITFCTFLRTLFHTYLVQFETILIQFKFSKVYTICHVLILIH